MINRSIFQSYIITFFLFFLFTSSSSSEIIKKFSILGNEELQMKQLMFSNLKIGEQISQNKLNKALKDLY